MKKILQGLLIVSSIALISAGCNQEDDSTNSSANNASQNTNSGSNANTPTNTSTNTPANAASTKTFVVEGDNFKFAPSELRVKQGDTVVINFKNTGGFHDWVLDELNAATKQLGDGTSETITFVASKKGTFEYYCSVGQHRQLGMVGKLIVE